MIVTELPVLLQLCLGVLPSNALLPGVLLREIDLRQCIRWWMLPRLWHRVLVGALECNQMQLTQSKAQGGRRGTSERERNKTGSSAATLALSILTLYTRVS